MTRVFVDTDVCLDLLSGREPFSKPAQLLFSLADKGKVKIYVSSISFANLDYVLRSRYSATNSSKILGKFKTLVHVLPVDDKTIELSIASDFTDFEDAIQYSCAIENNLTLLITRNIKDYRKAKIDILSPEAFLALSG